MPLDGMTLVSLAKFTLQTIRRLIHSLDSHPRREPRLAADTACLLARPLRILDHVGIPSLYDPLVPAIRQLPFNRRNHPHCWRDGILDKIRACARIQPGRAREARGRRPWCAGASPRRSRWTLWWARILWVGGGRDGRLCGWRFGCVVPARSGGGSEGSDGSGEAAGRTVGLGHEELRYVL